MDKKLKAKWVKALRSGKIEKGRGALLDDKGAMCCLGVLGRICGIDDRWLIANAGSVAGTGFDWLEQRIDRETVDLLADMNDGYNKRYSRPRSFKQIANYIEKNL